MGFKNFYKESVRKSIIKREAEGDFGDEAQAMSSAEISYAYPKTNKNKLKWSEARGFIKPDGKVERIGDMGHEDFARDVGYPITVDGKLVTKKFPGSKTLAKYTGLVRWSPETASFSVYLPMTLEQIKTIKEIVKSYGYKDLMLDYQDKNGNMQLIEFNDSDPSKFNARMTKVQNEVNDKKFGQ